MKYLVLFSLLMCIMPRFYKKNVLFIYMCMDTILSH